MVNQLEEDYMQLGHISGRIIIVNSGLIQGLLLEQG